MSGILQNLFGYITTKPLRKIEYRVFETTNECDEKVYVQYIVSDKVLRGERLESLYKKCKGLLSFLSGNTSDPNLLSEIINLTDHVKYAIDRKGSIDNLVRRFEKLESKIKLRSGSSMNLLLKR
jgi:hypothetical protein